MNTRIIVEGNHVTDETAYATQFVSDQDEALNFYTKILDFEKRVDNPTPRGPRFVTVGVKGQDFQPVSYTHLTLPTKA